MIDEGRLGKIYHYRATSSRIGPSTPTCPKVAKACGDWTLAVAGSGVTGDLLAHCIDTAIWLNGPIVEVSAMTETFVKSDNIKPERNRK